jgi:hypothetical protein
MMALMLRNGNYLFDVCLIALLVRSVRELFVLAKSGGSRSKNCLASSPQYPLAKIV